MTDSGSNAPLDRLAAAWATHPPAPDLASYLSDEVRADPATLRELLRLDLEARLKHGEPIRLEDYRATISAASLTPGSELARLVLMFERRAGVSAEEALRRLGEAFAADIESMIGEGATRVPTLDSATADAVTRAPEPDASRSAARPSHGLVKGGRLGPYELRRRLGSGGFGEVWLAHRTHPELDVAIKVLKPGMASESSVRRFEVEAQALAYLEHRYIARIHDAGTAEGLPFIAMEFVDGRPLTQYCDARRLTIQQRLELMVRVCEGVQHAHQRGLIHRDLKPDNILVTEIVRHEREIDEHDRRLVVASDGDSVTLAIPKVVDFGLAKAAESSVRLSDATLTRESWGIMGTPEYMAPEQAGQDLHQVTQKADIFALGVILYELLSGTLPLTREELRQRAFEELVAILRNTPRPEPATRFSQLEPGAVNLASLCRGEIADRELSARLRSRARHLCGKALRLEPDKRFSSAAMLARDIRNYLTDRDFEEAAAEPRRDRLRRHVRRHRAAYAAATAVVVALVAGVAGTSTQWWRAESALRNANENAAALAGFTTMILDNVVADEDLSRSPIKVAEGFSALVDDSLRDEVVKDPLVRANMCWRLGQLNLRIGRIEDAVGPLQESAALFAELGRTHEEAMVHRDLSIVYFRRADGDRSREEADRSVALLRQSLDPSDPALFDAMEGVGHALKWSQDHDAARSQYETVIDLRREAGQDAVQLAETRFDLALVMEIIAGGARDRDGLLEATEMMEQVRNARREAVGVGTPDEPLLVATAELARMRKRCWQAFQDDPRGEQFLADARRWYDEAIEQGHRVLGGTHWRVVQWEYNRGTLRVDAGESEAGFEEMERSLDLYWRMRDANLATQCGLALAKKYDRADRRLEAETVARRVMGEIEADPDLRAQVPAARLDGFLAFLP